MHIANHEDVARGWNLQPGQALDANHQRVPAAAIRDMARARLEEIIKTGQGSAANVMRRVFENTPEDRIVNAGAIQPIVEQDGTLRLGLVNAGEFGLHRHAAGQLFERVGMHRAYAEELGVAGMENTWRRDLLKHAMEQHLANSTGRYLVRSNDRQIRGILSDKYRRLDSRPLLDAFIGAANMVGAIPIEGVGGELRTSIRAIIPKVYEPVEGECMVFGLAWTNSDYGCGTYQISAFGLRLVCLNGLVTESALKQVHLGGKLPDNIAFSAATYAKDTEAMTSATTDVVRHLLGEGALEKRSDAIKASASKELNIDAAMRGVAKALTKSEAEAVRGAYDGADVVMLPAGTTPWRFSNALSFIANNATDPERRIELQQLAGKAVA